MHRFSAARARNPRTVEATVFGQILAKQACSAANMHPDTHLPERRSATVKEAKTAARLKPKEASSTVVIHPKMHPGAEPSSKGRHVLTFARTGQGSKRKKQGDMMARLDVFAGDFAEIIRREFAQEIARDPKGTKTFVLRVVRRHLPPRRGRPNDPRIDAAVRMIEQGKSVKEILRLQIPGFETLDSYGRYLADKGLRTAITRRRKHSCMDASKN